MDKGNENGNRKNVRRSLRKTSLSEKASCNNENLSVYPPFRMKNNFLGRRREDDIDLEKFLFDPKVDKLEEIVETFKTEKGELVMKVRVKERSTGIRPEDVMLSNTKLGEIDAALLIDFYESKIIGKNQFKKLSENKSDV